ncbi:MAG: hypothetical protein GTN70_05710 [Deltaproteobacteria bacterium]|nr:hypothetical protein [Deltaproteobacteria bacterium]NIS77176.1 hypothetical protein [Deltaproteobacteria bacterium]
MGTIPGSIVKALSLVAIWLFIVSCGDTSSAPPGRPDIQVGPSAHDFGDVDFDKPSSPLEVTILNSGTSSLIVSDIALTDTRNFTLDTGGGSSPCNSVTPVLSPGRNCTVGVAFKPKSLGTVNGGLIVTSSDPGEPLAGTVLAGNGIPLPSFGIFLPTGQDIGNNTTNSVVLGDVDGDGDLDIVEGNNLENLVWRNDGAGVFPVTFTDSGQSLQVSGSGRTIALSLGDVDNDGDLDLIEGNELNNILWTNRSVPDNLPGIFIDTDRFLGNRTAITTSLALGDVDRDFALDIVVGNRGEVNQVLINDGSGLFADLPQGFNEPSDTRSVALGDLDSDGDLDIVVGNFIQPNQVLFKDGFGFFTNSGQNLGDPNTVSVALGDVDGDGDLDIVAGNENQLNRVWLNFNDRTGLPTGVFVEKLQPNFTASATSSIALGDVEGDGDLDIVEGNFGQPNRIWLNDGLGNFTPDIQALGSSNTTSLDLGDVDGDGDLDIVEGNFGEPNRVWLNQP